MKKIKLFLLLFMMTFIFSYMANSNKVFADEIYEGDMFDVEVEEGNRDFRGVWVSALVSDIPRYQSKSQYQSSVTKILDNMEKYNFNTLVFHIRIYNDAFYESQYCNYSSLYRTNPDWEALPWIIEECHKRGIEFHAWMNPYRVSTSVSSTKEAIAKKFPTSNAAHDPLNLLIGNEFVILDPGNPTVQEFLVNVCMEVIENYDVDAIHFDDYFYAAGVDDSYTYKKYGSEYSKITDFRRASVTKLIKSLHENITKLNEETNRAVKLGISPTAIYKCGDGVVTYDEDGHAITTGALMSTYFDQHYDSACADTLSWIQKGYIDYIVPQLYVNGEQFLNVSTWWDKVVKNEKCNFVAGITDISCEWDHFNKLENAGGVCLFSYKGMSKLMSSEKAQEYFKEEALPNKASYMDLPLDYSPEISVVTHNDGYEVVINSVDSKINYAAIFKGDKNDLFKKENIIGYIDYNTSNTYYDKTTLNENTYYGVVLVSNDGSYSLGSVTTPKNEIFKITYKNNSDEILKTEYLRKGEKLTYPEYEVQDGYNYTWDKNIETASETTVITLNIEADKYIIKYVDPDGNILFTQLYNYGDKLDLPEIPTSNKYEYKRWKVGSLYKVEGHDTISLSYEYIYYNVSFYYNNELIKTEQMHIDEELDFPTVKVDNSLQIVGWDCDGNLCTGEMSINLIVKEKKPIIKFVDFETNTLIQEYQTVYNSSYVLNDIFDNNYDETAVIEFYLNNKKVDSINNIDEDAIVKVKVIIIKEYTVTFDVDGETTEVKVKDGEKAVKPADPEKVGYVFLGWYVDDALYDFEKAITSDIKLVAKFEEVPSDEPGDEPSDEPRDEPSDAPEEPGDAPEEPNNKSEEKSGCGSAASILFLSFVLLGLCIIKKKQ